MSCNSTHAPKACCAPSIDRGEATPTLPLERSLISWLPKIMEGKIALTGGTFLMGTDYEGSFPDDGEGPIREVTIDAFQIDRTPVTNTLFAQFVNETGYITEAERFGCSFVFWSHIPHNRFRELVVDTLAAAPWWCQVPGASWKQPEGPGSTINSRPDHPVVHVSWNDAQAFCRWSGQRLPTEAEWEYAARGGLVQKIYPWGDRLRPNNQHLCNIWQGQFPNVDTAEDGFAGTCPVTAFPPNGYGLYSVAGNTWEWCSDWFHSTHHRTASQINPQGPPRGSSRVIRGGSFLCHKSYCNRYRVAARSSNTPDSSTSHMGFRCVL